MIAVLGSLPRREPGSTKFTSGEVVVIGGSRGLTGAVCMSAEAAIRSGAGYATVAVPDELEHQWQQVPEWFGAFGVMVTLVWLYLEMLRLLGKLRDAFKAK